MASSYPEVNLKRAKELGKYDELTGFSSGKGKPHEKSRVLAAEDIEIIRKCGGCDKNMSKVKDSFVCSCKWAIHCSKSCFKTSKHKCEESSSDQNVKIYDVLTACDRHYFADIKDNKSPSSDKIKNLLKITKGANHKILNYADRGIATAAFVVGSAYMTREFERGATFFIPPMFKEQSVAKTNEIAVNYLKVAAEGDISEAMYCMFRVLVSEGGLLVDRRVAHLWLDKAYAMGSMKYLIQVLETPMDNNFPQQFSALFNIITGKSDILMGSSFAYLLMATRFRELKAWNGKTGMGQPFYGFPMFKSVMELIGGLKNEQSGPSFIEGEKETILFISARPGHSDIMDKCLSFKRDENNLKFLQGVKGKMNPDYQLVSKTSNVDGRTNYLISCKHNQVKIDEAELTRDSQGARAPLKKSLEDESKSYKSAGECEPCVQEAKQRLRAVKLGIFSISITPISFKKGFYAARYAKDDGVIVQDIFNGDTKPDVRQLLQCLMSNPADLHPLAIAEDANLFWPIIWFWGSIYEAVHDSCDKTTLDAIYRGLGDEVTFPKSSNASALAAFPEAVAGEWRMACGNENCVRVDHEVKMSLCAGCKVRRYCDEACQSKDWDKHKQFCKAGKKTGKMKKKLLISSCRKLFVVSIP